MGTHSHSMRVLVRPPPSPASAPPLPSNPPPQPDSSPPPQNGVVVVGFVGKRHEDVANFINKIIGSNVFGSGNLDSSFNFEAEKMNPAMYEWFKCRKLRFYHDTENEILYLLFSSARCPFTGEESPGTEFGFGSFLDDEEFRDLQGLLFMFSVCHIIIHIQEGSRFDTQMLKTFRILQSAKHAMAPFITSQTMPSTTARAHSSASSRSSVSRPSPHNPSPGTSRGILNRNASPITPTSGLGSYLSLLPGHCIPVILFVFLDDVTEIFPNGNMEEPSAASSLNLSLNNLSRPGLPAKGSGSVVVLARPANKSEAGLRRKLQSSLEAQIRFSIKKCRMLSGSESSHAGSRGASSLAPLFSLDASKAVSIVDACSTRTGESLDFVIGLVEEVLDGKSTSDSLLLESHQQNANKEDILSVKEFICRQHDILRGRGGLVSSSNSGSTTGVGMVAVAAAAAAASASSGASTTSGKALTVPQLPSLEMWFTSCQLIIRGILSAKLAYADEMETKIMPEQHAESSAGENVTSFAPLEPVVSHLQNGIGLNAKFSTLWCQKAFPFAKEVYSNELPTCYPSSQHEDHLRKALHALNSMVKGPAVRLYEKKLKDECLSIWSSGRQRCDAVSLTGRPCMHQRHDVGTRTGDESNPHSSGFVYLHACACGRSRRLRPDPFDYESANITDNIFSECDKLIPAIQFPEGSTKGPIQPSSWKLFRIGIAKYYDPSKGLLQSGFCATQKFLLRWIVYLERLNEEKLSIQDDSLQVPLDSNNGVETAAKLVNKSTDATQQSAVGIQMRLPMDFIKTGTNNTSAARGLPNHVMRKPFSEVVAGPATTTSAFPPLFPRKQALPDSDKGIKLSHIKQKDLEKNHATACSQGSEKVVNIALFDKVLDDNEIAGNGYKYSNHFSHIGSSLAHPDMNACEQTKPVNSAKPVTIYVGFEHECPHGHRFILTPNHLEELGSLPTAPEENLSPSSMENSERRQDYAKLGKNGAPIRTRRQPNGMRFGGVKMKSLEKSKEKIANGNVYFNKSSARQRKDRSERTNCSNLAKEFELQLKPETTDDVDFASPLWNRNLPIYMNCPHCRDGTKIDASDIKFAGTISQLQRIFVVTPPFPAVLAIDPIIQFEVSCLSSSVPDRGKKLKFSLGSPVILPPESVVSLRLPFVYGVELDDGSLCSLKPFENQPQLTAWITKGSTLQFMSKRSNLDLEMFT